MTRFERWSLVIAVLGFGAVVYTINEAATAFKSDTYSKATPWILDLDKVFLERPELRPYFYQSETNIPTDRTNQVFAMAEYVLDTYDSFLSQRMLYGHQSLDPDWIVWMKSSFDTSPLLVTYLEQHKDWYRSGQLYEHVYLEWKFEHRNAPQRELHFVTVVRQPSVNDQGALLQIAVTNMPVVQVQQTNGSVRGREGNIRLFALNETGSRTVTDEKTKTKAVIDSAGQIVYEDRDGGQLWSTNIAAILRSSHMYSAQFSEGKLIVFASGRKTIYLNLTNGGVTVDVE